MVSYAAVISNGHHRPLRSWASLPAEAQADFDYLSSKPFDWHEDRFVFYRGAWHDVFDAQPIAVAPAHVAYGFNVHPSHPLAAWAAIATTSHWSGTCFRWLTDEEAFERDMQTDRYNYIIVGRYVA